MVTTSSSADGLPLIVNAPENLQFIEELISEIRKGKSITPFIGSGCSAPSGIIMGSDFGGYLAHVLFLCVAEERELEKCKRPQGRWDLRKHGWPPHPDSEQLRDAQEWIERKFHGILNRGDDTKHAAVMDTIQGGDTNSNSETEKENMRTERQKIASHAEDVATALLTPLWPLTISRDDNEFKQKMLRRLLSLLSSEHLVTGGYAISGYSPTSEDAIIEKAIRSLHDWRATLNFLSRLQLVGGRTLLLESPDQSVVDGFNFHITRNRRPNLIHNMLCHLAGPARFRIILTTNFDSLIEEAFSEMNEHVEVISVSLKGELPHPNFVHSQNTVIKVHGTLSETRADFSLDESPSRENKRRFFHYLQGRYPEEAPNPQAFPSSHLLVCGYSGNDNRCMEMIKYVLDAGDKTTKIFWICNSDSGLGKLKKLFTEPSYAGRLIFATPTPRTDLLLYELFQHLCLSLPRGGFSYQYTANVPPAIPTHRPVTQETNQEITLDKHAKNPATSCYKMSKWLADSSMAPREKLAIIDGNPGVMATLRNVIGYVENKHRMSTIWLELEDYQDTYCLAYELLLILSIRLGLYQLGHADIVPVSFIKACQDIIITYDADEANRMLKENWEKHLSQLLKYYFKIQTNQWIIVLYGRNGSGSCSGWTEQVYWNNGEEFGGMNNAGHFAPFVNALCEKGFSVICAPYSDERYKRDQPKWDTLKNMIGNCFGKFGMVEDPNIFLPVAREYDLPTGIPVKMVSSVRSVNLCKWTHWLEGASFTPDEPQGNSVVEFQGVMNELLQDKIRGNGLDDVQYRKNLRFLYASSLFRQSRHYSAFLTEATLICPERFNDAGIDNDWCRNEEVSKILISLKDKVFYPKPGGFAWAYRDFRLGIRLMIESLPKDWLKERNVNERFRTWRSHYHYWIADWYLRAFYTTGHAMPLMEALYHLYQTILHLPSFRADAVFEEPASGSQEVERAWRRYRRWRNAVCDMAKALRIGGSAIRLWLGPAQFRAWFSSEGLKEIVPNLKLPDKIASGLGLDSKKFKELDDHADGIHALLSSELFQLVAHNTAESRLKQHLTLMPYLPRESISISAAPVDDEAFSDENCWKQSSGLVRELSELVFTSGLSGEALAKRVTRLQRRELQKNNSDWSLFYLVQILNEWAFLFLCRGKMHQILTAHAEDSKKNVGGRRVLGLDETSRKFWVAVSVLCNSSLDFGRLIHPALDGFEQRERIKALCIYAISLGRLGRFYEAHRRLNEANALLTKVQISNDEKVVLLGIMELRRAEVHLLEALFLKPLQDGLPVEYSNAGLNEEHIKSRYDKSKSAGSSDEYGRVIIAKLDDSWRAMETAERLLAGKLHSPRWGARLCALKLQCLAEFYVFASKFECRRALCRRTPNHPFHHILEIIQKGMASSQGHGPLRLRMIDFACKALGHLPVDECGPAFLREQLGEMISDTFNAIVESSNKNLREYMQCIKDSISTMEGLSDIEKAIER